MKRIWKFTIENLDTIFAIAVSLFAAIFGIFGGNQIALLAGIATTLGILAYGIIRDRAARETLGENIQRLENAVHAISTDKVTASSFFVNRATARSLPDFLKSSSESLDIMGSTLISIGAVHRWKLRDIKERGGKVRVIVANPANKKLLEIITMRVKSLRDADGAKIHINTTLADLLPLVGRSENGGEISIRITDFDPTFSYIGVDVKKPTGQIQIEFFLNQVGVDRNPIFYLESINDLHWFSEYKNQFEILWELGKDANDLRIK